MTQGDCHLCGEAYTKRGMSRHLRACLPESPGDSALHLRIADARRTDYWIHLAVATDTTLASLDSFLRRFWLECCGHMSAFEIGSVWYEKPTSEGELSIGLGPTPRSMDVPIGSVVEPDDDEFVYEYDFGTTTALDIRVVDAGSWSVDALADRLTGDLARNGDETGIVLLARNRPPEVDCGVCGDPATQVCTTCLRERGPDAWLCASCASDHEEDCARPTYLPYVNSPRTGVCGYTG
jgi:hypothetical protein